jgi:hypothetical protein
MMASTTKNKREGGDQRDERKRRSKLNKQRERGKQENTSKRLIFSDIEGGKVSIFRHDI